MMVTGNWLTKLWSSRKNHGLPGLKALKRLPGVTQSDPWSWEGIPSPTCRTDALVLAVSPSVTWPLTSPGSPQDWDQGALFLFIYLFMAGGCLFVYGHAWRLSGILVSPPGIVPGPRKWKSRVLTIGPPGNSPSEPCWKSLSTLSWNQPPIVATT